MTLRTIGMNETCACEKFINSTIYQTKDNLVSIDQRTAAQLLGRNT